MKLSFRDIGGVGICEWKWMWRTIMSSSGVSSEACGGDETEEKWEARRSSESSVEVGSGCEGAAIHEIEEAVDEAVA